MLFSVYPNLDPSSPPPYILYHSKYQLPLPNCWAYEQDISVFHLKGINVILPKGCKYAKKIIDTKTVTATNWRVRIFSSIYDMDTSIVTY